MIIIYLSGEIHTLDITDNKIFLDCAQVHIESVTDCFVMVSKSFELFRLRLEDVYRAAYGGNEPSPALAGMLLARDLLHNQQEQLGDVLTRVKLLPGVEMVCSRDSCKVAAKFGLVFVGHTGSEYVLRPYCVAHLPSSSPDSVNQRLGEVKYPVGEEG